jgi:hypothetical protein
MNVNLSKPTPKFLDLHYVWTTQSTEDPSVVYITIIDVLAEDGDSNVLCSCPGFKFRKSCRHLTDAWTDLKSRFE